MQREYIAALICLRSIPLRAPTRAIFVVKLGRMRTTDDGSWEKQIGLLERATFWVLVVTLVFVQGASFLFVRTTSRHKLTLGELLISLLFETLVLVLIILTVRGLLGWTTAHLLKKWRSESRD